MQILEENHNVHVHCCVNRKWEKRLVTSNRKTEFPTKIWGWCLCLVSLIHFMRQSLLLCSSGWTWASAAVIPLPLSPRCWDQWCEPLTESFYITLIVYYRDIVLDYLSYFESFCMCGNVISLWVSFRRSLGWICFFFQRSVVFRFLVRSWEFCTLNSLLPSQLTPSR